MKSVLHSATSRGHADHGWLDSHHSFSFANYYDPDRMGFGLLRVLNDDIVAGGKGFGKHPHQNMEIISIPLGGALQHMDSLGSSGVIETGEVQVMSAGRGIEHGEFNASKTEAVNFLQIWIHPESNSTEPGYAQKKFAAKDRMGKLQYLVAPANTKVGALAINQNAYLSRIDLEPGAAYTYTLNDATRGLYLFLIAGAVECAGEHLGKRDALAMTETDTAVVKASAKSELLFIEVPLN